MILVIKNGKIIGIDKTLLNILDVDLQNLSSIINKIELEIAALRNKNIELNHKHLKVVKKDILTLEDIDIYDIFPVEEEVIHSITPDTSIPVQTPQIQEETLEIKPEITIPEINLNETYEAPKIEPIEPITPVNLEENKEPQIFEENKTPQPEFTIENELSQIEPEFIQKTPSSVEAETPSTIAKAPLEQNLVDNTLDLEEQKETIEEVTPIQTQPEGPIEISLSFEDEISEVEKILELSSEEAKEVIYNDLNQAKKELGIDDEIANELLEELYKQIESEKTTFQKALKISDYDTIHKTAHKLKGAALNLRLSKLSYILKVIDEKSKQNVDIQTLKNLIDKFYNFFEKINDKVKKTSRAIPIEIQQLIKRTLQEYLETQNEKKFKKDKKYIEKLLNTKIDSIEDLKNILKGNE
ncbi:MAG: hypothetical protein GXO01_04190 [Epsilonproteobacteria bacterium]|nr:hypothetical protein [Campylobacterota bacterium]